MFCLSLIAIIDCRGGTIMMVMISQVQEMKCKLSRSDIVGGNCNFYTGVEGGRRQLYYAIKRLCGRFITRPFDARSTLCYTLEITASRSAHWNQAY